MANNVSVRFKIVNLAQIQKAFKKSPRTMGFELKKAIQKTVLIVERQSKINTPVDTGRLRASHKTRFTGEGLKFAGEISTNTNYDRFVHDGTSKMQGRPYMQKAIDSNQLTIEKLFKDAVKKALDKIARMT